MPSTRPVPSPSRGRLEELALLVYLEHLLRGRRVLYLGQPRAARTAWEATCALFDTSDLYATRVEEAVAGQGAAPAGAGLAVEAALRPREARERFDVVVVPDHTLLERQGGSLAELRDLITPHGLALIGGSARPDPAGERRRRRPSREGPAASTERLPNEYLSLYEAASEHFPVVRMIGQASFAGYAAVDFEAAEREPVAGAGLAEALLDTTLVDAAQTRFETYYAVAAMAPVALEALAVIQVPGDVSDPEAVERRLQAQLALEREVEQLEGRLQERAAHVRALEAEVRRRGALLRDAVEAQRAAGTGPHERAWQADLEGLRSALATSRAEVERLRAQHVSATARAIEAESARTEAQFALDEVSGHLALLRTESAGEPTADAEHGRAQLEGFVRGLRARAAELEETRDNLAARLALAEADLEAATERERNLERQVGQVQDRLELEIVRAQGQAQQRAAPPGDEHPARDGRPVIGATPGEEISAATPSAPAAPVLGRPSLAWSEHEVEAQVGRLSGELVASRERGQQLEGELDRLEERLGQLEQSAAGARLGYELRLAELQGELDTLRLTPPVRASAVDALMAEADALAEPATGEAAAPTAAPQPRIARLEGECRGLRARLADLERSATERLAGQRRQIEALDAEREREVEAAEAARVSADSLSRRAGARVEGLVGFLRDVRAALEDLSDSVEQMGRGAGGSLAPPPMRMVDDEEEPLPTATDTGVRQARLVEQLREKDGEIQGLRTRLLQARTELEAALGDSSDQRDARLQAVARLLAL